MSISGLEMKEPSVVEVQHQIRANASQLQDYFSDLYAWEKSISKEDAARKRAAKSSTSNDTPPPRTARVIGVHGSEEGAANEKKPDSRTYDKGYKRWEKFDVDAALKEADEEGTSVPKVEEAHVLSSAPRREVATAKAKASSTTTKSREELEKEEGNAHYKRGDYVAAIKSYTRCLGYNPQNAVVLSNRAMAYLKNREFASAEDDCTLALKADPTHVKSYSRRGTARNLLGKHRLALLDFHRAMTLDPKSRQIQTQLQSTRDLIRTAIKRSPKRTQFSIEVLGESAPIKQPRPETDSDAMEDKENIGSQQPGAGIVMEQKSPPPEESGSISVTSSSSTTQAAAESIKKRTSAILPKLPKKAPVSSYEFGRVWKTLALCGDAAQKARVLSLRADYLRMISPTTLRSIFKTGMESDVLCEIFQVLRHAVLSQSDSSSAGVKDNVSFSLAFASELTKVTRFNMTIMLLSGSEKEDMTWVLIRLQELVDESQKEEVLHLKKLYELL